MQPLATQHWPGLRSLLADEAPCELVPHHVLTTGFGSCWVDRWPEPRVAALFAGGNLGFGGAADALPPEELRQLLDELLERWHRVFIDPPEGFGPLVVSAVGRPMLWPRVLYAWPGVEPVASPMPGIPTIRRIGPGDAGALAALETDITWISDTFDGPAALARSELAWGAFDGHSLTAVAASFYVGHDLEELGVVTARAYRGRGLSTACAAALIRDIRRRDRMPCWATTPDNQASRRVAEKLGFQELRQAMQYMAGAATTGALPYDGRSG